MRQILGSNMPTALQAQARARFVHRSVGTHDKAQFATVAEWLANTLFWVTKANTLAKRASCHSSPTWPQNPELRVA